MEVTCVREPPMCVLGAKLISYKALSQGNRIGFCFLKQFLRIDSSTLLRQGLLFSAVVASIPRWVATALQGSPQPALLPSGWVLGAEALHCC